MSRLKELRISNDRGKIELERRHRTEVSALVWNEYVVY